MSEHKVTCGDYVLCWGRSHASGPFVMLWDISDTLIGCVADIDCHGCTIRDVPMTLGLAGALLAPRHEPLTCQHVQDIAFACGFGADVIQQIADSWHEEPSE